MTNGIARKNAPLGADPYGPCICAIGTPRIGREAGAGPRCQHREHEPIASTCAATTRISQHISRTFHWNNEALAQGHTRHRVGNSHQATAKQTRAVLHRIRRREHSSRIFCVRWHAVTILRHLGFSLNWRRDRSLVRSARAFWYSARGVNLCWDLRWRPTLVASIMLGHEVARADRVHLQAVHETWPSRP